MATDRQVNLSILIPTRNEERNIVECLASVAFAAERIVFDSMSTDQTIDLAQESGARVVQREFDNFATHKNWALENIEFEHDWILIVDADERVTSPLASEITCAIAAIDAADGYYIARQNIFQGKWIRHAGMYPDWQLRLFRRGHAHYEDRIVHEHMLVNGSIRHLKNALVHHDFKGIERYFERHNHYTSLEAVEANRMLSGKAQNGDSIAADIFRRGPHRRRAIKQFAYRSLPARALLVFLYMYIWKLGFLDGRKGFRYSLIRAFHEYQISLKLEELGDPKSPMSTKYEHLLQR